MKVAVFRIFIRIVEDLIQAIYLKICFSNMVFRFYSVPDVSPSAPPPMLDPPIALPPEAAALTAFIP